MKKIIRLNWVAILFLLSCNSKIKECNSINLKVLNLYPVNCMMRIPEYKVIDIICYDSQTILNYNINSLDGLLNIVCFIKSYEKNPNAYLNINAVMGFQKQEVEFNKDSVKLLTESFRNIDKIKIGYLKYLVHDHDKKFYESRIFFYRGRKLVVLWLSEEILGNKLVKYSLADCILQNITFK